MRLIDADALDFSGLRYEPYPHYAAKDMVDEAPAIDAVPVVHGRWIPLTECSNEGVYCSECHKKVYKADYAVCVKGNKLRSNCCPNCGARMDSE